MKDGRPLIAAVSDIHAPRHLKQFEQALQVTPLDGVDLFVFAGDLVHNDDHARIPEVLGILREHYLGPVYACPGNNEFDSSLEKYRSYGGIVWLNDESATVGVGGFCVRLVGTKGVRDVVTPWLVWGVTPNPDVEGTRRLYAWREVRLDELLSEARGGERVVVFSHFAPTYQTLEGENPSQFGELGSKRLEALIYRHQPDVWIHGHAHYSRRTRVELGRTRVYNVALPAMRGITLIEL